MGLPLGTHLDNLCIDHWLFVMIICLVTQRETECTSVVGIGQRNKRRSRSRAKVPPARIYNFKVHLMIVPGSDECFEGGFIQAINCDELQQPGGEFKRGILSTSSDAHICTCHTIFSHPTWTEAYLTFLISFPLTGVLDTKLNTQKL